MEEDETLIREYSELPGLQKACRIEYSICNKDGMLCLCEKAKQSGVSTSVSCPLGGITEQKAHQILRFVYENAVPLQNLEDIVADCRLSV